MKSTSVTLNVPGNDLMSDLVGEQDILLRRIESAFPGSAIHVRGNKITIDGDHASTIRLVFDEVVTLLQKGLTVDERTLDRAIDMVRFDERPSEILTAEILRTSRGKPVRARSAGQKRYVEAVTSGIVTFAIGPAGTGKSWLAVAMAVRSLQAGQVDRIVLTRPLVEAGERVGFLPGDLLAKVDPYLRPLYDALFDMVDTETAQRLLDRGQVEVAPLAFMRGRTLNNSFVILDEAQNTTPEQMKMFLTRVGFGSRVVITGDISQVDVPGGRSGLDGLEHRLAGIDGLSFVRLGARDVVRHRIVQDIVEAYDRESSFREHDTRGNPTETVDSPGAGDRS
ncbi:MAG: phosphate starvation-inducible protein PhoH [Acidimicrobiaceae bacterium]|nr:phosphate starvation-inducible protein PhoH [Acidimicrobiaceae bacterium]|tara:strand:- start:266 stop:1279 length:1014 start_codon:yes stop_codon:yes gene_type:complete